MGDVLDERGEPVVVEYIGPHCYLASGWWGGVGRYTSDTTPAGALRWWQLGAFLPKRDRHAERMQRAHERFAKKLEGAEHLTLGAFAASDERPGGRPEEE